MTEIQFVLIMTLERVEACGAEEDGSDQSREQGLTMPMPRRDLPLHQLSNECSMVSFLSFLLWEGRPDLPYVPLRMALTLKSTWRKRRLGAVVRVELYSYRGIWKRL